MRALTVRQPWAWAIIHGGKDVENRTRNIVGDYRGPVAIHAAVREAAPYNEVAAEIFRLTHRWVLKADTAAVIGVVDLVDVHHALDVGDDSDLEEMCSPWAMENHHHLVLANPRALATPIPAKGRLGLWRPDDALAGQIALMENTAVAS